MNVMVFKFILGVGAAMVASGSVWAQRNSVGGCYLIDDHIKAQHTNFRFVYAVFPTVEENGHAVEQQWWDFTRRIYPEMDFSVASSGCADADYIAKSADLQKKKSTATVIKVDFTPRDTQASHKRANGASQHEIKTRTENQSPNTQTALHSDDLGVPAEAQALARQYAADFDRTVAASDAERAKAVNNGRKRLVLKQHPKCLRAVDIRRDSDVKTLFYYSIENICGETLVALWCEGSKCKPTSKAATITGGAKEGSWLDTRWSGDVKFNGTACLETYQGRTVYYDKKRNQCWLWDK